MHSEINSIEYAAGAKILQNRLSTERIYMLINSIECAAGAKILQNRPSTRRVYFLKSTALSAPQARKFCKIASIHAVVKVADDVRGHSTDSLIHKDHVDVVTVALIHFVALIHG